MNYKKRGKMKEKFGFYNALKNLFKYSDNNKKMYIKCFIKLLFQNS